MMTDTTSAPLHWAAPLIGRPWGPDPDDNCWGLVRLYFRRRHGLELPLVATGDSDEDGDARTASIKRAAQTSGWRPVDPPPRADDVVLMWGPTGRHVGVMIEANRRLGVLHAHGCMRDGQPTGAVVFQTLRDATEGGYGRFEFWREGAP
jgi:cell wall-associated NlpC family hydrolase